MIKPYIQYGRSNGVMLFGITSSIVDSPSFNKIKLLSSEFNTATLIGTTKAFDATLGPRPVNFVGLYLAEDGSDPVHLPGGFNDIVTLELNVDVASSRGDARLFKFPDGTAGALIERTGQFFALSEFVIPAPPSPPTITNVYTPTSSGGCYPVYTPSNSYASGDRVSMTTSGLTYNYACMQGPASSLCRQSAFTPGEQYSSLAWVKENLCKASLVEAVVEFLILAVVLATAQEELGYLNSPPYPLLSFPAQSTTGAITPASAIPPAPGSAASLSTCGSAFVPGANYESGDVVSVIVAGALTNYVCQADPQSVFCKQEKLTTEGGGFYSGSAWTNQDPCDPGRRT